MSHTIRKNIYNDKIFMILASEIITFNQMIIISSNPAVKERLGEYIDLLLNTPLKLSETNVGILLDSEVTIRLETLIDYFYSEVLCCKISLKDLQKSFLYALTTKPNGKIFEALQSMTMNRLALEYRAIKNQYGEEILNYILTHKNYNYIQDIDPVVEGDKNILLFQNGMLLETEVFRDKDESIQRTLLH